MATEKETPRFQVTQAPGFATGLVMHLPGEEINWEVPPDWDTKKYGRHYASYGPSLSFLPLNPAAEKLMEEHRALIVSKNKPKPTVDDERFAKMEALHLQAMNSALETQALLRRMLENKEEAAEEAAKKKR